MSGAGFFLGTISPASTSSKPARALRDPNGIHQRAHALFFVGGGADAQFDAVCVRLIDQAVDAGAHRQSAAGAQLAKAARLILVKRHNAFIEIGALAALRDVA